MFVKRLLQHLLELLILSCRATQVFLPLCPLAFVPRDITNNLTAAHTYTRHRCHLFVFPPVIDERHHKSSQLVYWPVIRLSGIPCSPVLVNIASSPFEVPSFRTVNLSFWKLPFTSSRVEQKIAPLKHLRSYLNGLHFSSLPSSGSESVGREKVHRAFLHQLGYSKMWLCNGSNINTE